MDLIRSSGWTQFPPRLPFQPIFYPVLNEKYAVRMARDWNTKDAASGFAGYVTRFRVKRAYLEKHEVRQVGDAECREYWINAADLEEFNGNLVGPIEVIHSYENV